MGNYMVEFGENYIDTEDFKRAIATYVYHKLLGTENLKFLEMIEENLDEGWRKWKIIKHPVSHYNIKIEDKENEE